MDVCLTTWQWWTADECGYHSRTYHVIYCCIIFLYNVKYLSALYAFVAVLEENATGSQTQDIKYYWHELTFPIGFPFLSTLVISVLLSLLASCSILLSVPLILPFSIYHFLLSVISHPHSLLTLPTFPLLALFALLTHPSPQPPSPLVLLIRSSLLILPPPHSSPDIWATWCCRVLVCDFKEQWRNVVIEVIPADSLSIILRLWR